MADTWSRRIEHLASSIVYELESVTATEAGDKEAAGLLRWEAARNRYEADRLAERGAP